MAMEVEIAIVGGGLGGLALAIDLQERGIRAHVFEKAPKVRAHTGTAIVLAANGITVLDGIKPELGRAMLRDGHYVTRTALEFRHYSEPEKAMESPKPVGEFLITLWRCAQEVLAAEITEQSLLHWRSLNLHKEGEIKLIRCTNKDQEKTVFLDAGAGLSLWQVRVPEVSGETTKAYSQDLEMHGRDVRKARALRQMEDLEGLENMRAAMEGTDPDVVREARACDRLPLTTWSDPSRRGELLGDAAHGMYSGPGEGARTAIEDAHQLSVLLQEALDSPTPETAIADAVSRDEEIRIPCTTKIQGYAAESTGWPHTTPEWVRNLSPEENQKRSEDFVKWVKEYPEAMSGDLSSTYWKP